MSDSGSGQIINLRQVRKQKKRQDKEARAEQNRISFGRTRAEKNASKHAMDELNRTLDHNKLDPQPPGKE